MNLKDVDFKGFKSKTADVNPTQAEFQPRNKMNKQVIVLTSRVHPGESNS